MTDVSHQIMIDGRADSALTEALTEIEVMESVRGESRFRVRLVIDVTEGDYQFLADRRLVPGKDHELTIVAFVDQKPTVLVHGIIQGRETFLRHGGTGSFLDIQGADRRVLMDRNHSDYGAHSGAVPTIVAQLFAKQGFIPDIEFVESEIYTPLTKTLNQFGSDLDLVEELAAKSSVEFWIDWKLVPGKVLEMAHFRSQPPQGGGGLGGAAGKAALSLLGGGAPVLKMNTGDAKFTMTSFRTRRRTDVPNKSGTIRRVDVDSGRIESTSVPGPSTPELGKSPNNASIERSVPAGGTVSEARRLAEAALNDAAWAIEASVETTVYQLGGLLRPRQVVQVQGTGAVDDGEYFVWSVQHRINEVGHAMTVQLRRNATGDPGGGLL